ncbi:MAG: hypothetical protein R2695_02650 [Acidimicrobiales bacterium]
MDLVVRGRSSADARRHAHQHRDGPGDAHRRARLRPGGDPATAIDPPSIEAIAFGESATVQVDLQLPRFAVGTYAVVGTVSGVDPPARFRAETSHVPWLLFLIPLIVLVQLALLALRNRLRRWIHRPTRTTDPTLPSEATLPFEATLPSETPSIIDLRNPNRHRWPIPQSTTSSPSSVTSWPRSSTRASWATTRRSATTNCGPS